MELIRYEGEQKILSPAVVSRIVDFEREIKTLKEAEEKLKQAIKEAMEEHGIIKLESEELIINYIQPTDREQFDTKAFREAQPDLYDEYIKFTPVKASIRIKVK